MRVTALDPSLTSTGYASCDTTAWTWDTDTIRSSPTPGGGERGSIRRLEGIISRLDDMLTMEEKADLYVIEGPAFSKNVGMAHERAGLWWLMYQRLYQGNIPILVVKPNLRAKYVTGRGNAGKDEVMLAVSRRYETAEVRNNNEADAVALAAMGADLAGHPMLAVPAGHRAALNTLVMPDPIISPGRVRGTL